jgi:Abnormal spindle-like microcephaly-assoc'd, ASPM-SPD-2-Hydin
MCIFQRWLICFDSADVCVSSSILGFTKGRHLTQEFSMQSFSILRQFARRGRCFAASIPTVLLLLASFGAVQAQNAAVGRTLYTTPFVAGQPSCGSATCHAADPTRNQNRILRGTSAANIQTALNTVQAMAFLRGVVTTQNTNDLAAYIANPSAPPAGPAAQVSPTAVTFASTAVGLSSAGKTVTLTNAGSAALTINSVVSDLADFDATVSTCSVPGVIQPGGTCTISLHFFPTVAGGRNGSLTISHNAPPATSTVTMSAVATAAPAAGITKVMTEYRFAPSNYYFMTSRDEDKALLDTVAGFERTGQSFPVYSRQQAGTNSILRYFFGQAAKAGTRGTHFYTLVNSEKSALLQLNTPNADLPKIPFDEGIDSFAFPPVVEGIGGSCAAGQTPVYRMFRGGARFPDDPNHRFTVSRAIYDEFVALGWDGEGVKMCVPAQ